MPKYGVTLKLPGGGFARICGSKPMVACRACEAAVSAYLCDYPVSQGRTCDMPLCGGCRVPQSPGRDFCPRHGQQTLKLGATAGPAL
jgi:hypothetical protein